MTLRGEDEPSASKAIEENCKKVDQLQNLKKGLQKLSYYTISKIKQKTKYRLRKVKNRR